MTRLFAVTLAGLVLMAPAFAQAPPVAVTGAWSRATPPGAEVGAVYLTLDSPAGDRLVSASSPAAARAQVHEMTMDGTVMRMREFPAGLPLPAHQAVTLSPGGLHIMLVGLKAPLKQGDTVALHLVFQSAPAIDVMVPVAALGASAAPTR